MPNMDPLARQQGLLFEQSELLREQFMKFGEALQRLHGSIEELRDDLGVERQQRHSHEDLISSALHTLRSDSDGERRRQEQSQRQIEDRLLSLREEVAFRSRATETELQHVSGRMDVLRVEMMTQLGASAEKQRVALEGLQHEVTELLAGERALSRASFQELTDSLTRQLQAEVSERTSTMRALEVRLDVDVPQQIRHVEQQRHEADVQLRNMLEQQDQKIIEVEVASRSQFEDHQLRASEDLNALRIECLSAITTSSNDLLHQQTEKYAACLQLAEASAESRRIEGETILKTLQEQEASMLGERLSESAAVLDQRLSESVSALEMQAAREAQTLLTQMNNLNESTSCLESELDVERQNRTLVQRGFVAEVSEMKEQLQRETSAQQKVSLAIQGLLHTTSSLQQMVREEAKAHESLSEVLQARHIELREQTGELHASFEAELSQRLQAVSEHSKLGHEELWHVCTSMQDHHSGVLDRVQDLDQRARHVEEIHLKELLQNLDEVASLTSATNTKVETLEKISLQEQVLLTRRLDQYAHDLEQNRALVETLSDAEKNAKRQFIESENSQYRLYITTDGDIAIFRRNGWGKFADGSEFKGVPRWHAGVGGDKALVSVNREVQAHERDRFHVPGS